MIEKIEEIINNGIRDGYDIDTISKLFLQAIDTHKPHPRKTKKTKKICRPVLLISDSSCDDFE
jgi:hypothetical protein